MEVFGWFVLRTPRERPLVSHRVVRLEDEGPEKTGHGDAAAHVDTSGVTE